MVITPVDMLILLTAKDAQEASSPTRSGPVRSATAATHLQTETRAVVIDSFFGSFIKLKNKER